MQEIFSAKFCNLVFHLFLRLAVWKLLISIHVSLLCALHLPLLLFLILSSLPIIIRLSNNFMRTLKTWNDVEDTQNFVWKLNNYVFKLCTGAIHATWHKSLSYTKGSSFASCMRKSHEKLIFKNLQDDRETSEIYSSFISSKIHERQQQQWKSRFLRRALQDMSNA